MKLSFESKSAFARFVIIALGIWISCSIGFVLFNRHQSGTDWDSLTDLFLIAIGIPIAVMSAAIAMWAAGRRAVTSVACLAIVGSLAAFAWSLYLDDQKARQAADYATWLESEYGRECARFKDSENPFDFVFCLEDQEQKARKGP